MRRQCAFVATIGVAMALVAVVSFRPARADAQAMGIDIVERGQNRIVMDGILGDWRRFVELIALDERAQVGAGMGNWLNADDASIGFAIARDDQNLYLAAEVRDDSIIRSREHRPHDDAIVLTLAAQPGGRTVVYEFVIFPGDPGNYAGAVRLRGGRSGTVAGAQVVEAPLRSGAGYTLEVSIPWAAMPEIRANLSNLRGRVAYQDADAAGRAAPDSVLQSGPGDAQHAEALPPTAGSTGANVRDAIAEFQRSHELNGTEPFLDRNANFAGDGALERVAVFPRYIVAAGPGIAGGSRYAFVEYPFRSRDDVIEVVPRDVTGDGRLEIVMRLRVASPNNLTREVVYVWGVPSGDQLVRVFAHEVARQQGANRVSNRATYESGGRVRVSYDNNTGFTTQNFPRLIENGVIPPLLPWGDQRVVIYRWNEAVQRFDVERSEANPNAASTNGATSPGGAGAVTNPASATMTQAPSDVAAVLRLFRRQRGLADDARATFTAQGNVNGDATAETVQIYGRLLVVVGPRFMSGRSFYNLELPVNADADVLTLSLADVTDDGVSEILVRVRRTAQAQVRGQNLEAIKEYLMVYSLDDSHRGRVFAAEVVRRVGSDQVANAIRPIRAGRNGEIVIEAGQARGWNEQTYPFRDAPQPGFAPLLLPWDPARRRVTYRWNGNALAPVP